MEIPRRGIIITPDGTVEARQVDTTLAGLNKIVGGYIEAVTLVHSNGVKNNVHLYCDDEGKMKGYRPNALATILVEHYRPGFAMRDVIAGTVVVLGGDDDGEEADVPAAVVDAIKVIEQRAKAKFS